MRAHEEFTELPKRIPSLAGLKFEGIENITIESRMRLKKQFDSFVEGVKSSNSPTLLFLIGEWGSGKSDALDRYFKPTLERENVGTFFVTASTIGNCLHTKEFLARTNLDATKFLGALVCSIIEEDFGKRKNEKFPIITSKLRKIEDVEELLKSFIKEIMESLKYKRIVVFIDEVEKLLMREFYNVVDVIVRGLLEVINGQYQPITEEGAHPGFIHFIVCLTPDAFSKIRSEKEFQPIYGGLKRRIETVELEPLSKKESVCFLYDLLKLSYNNNLPEKMPINSFGIFNLLHYATLGIPGEIVAKLSRLFNFQKRGEKMKVVDYNSIIEFLQGQSVVVLGGESACLHPEILNDIINRSFPGDRPKVKEILNLLLGDLKPHKISEVAKKLDTDERYIEKLIGHIQGITTNLIGKLGITTLSPLKVDETKFIQILEENELIEEKEGRKILRIGDFEENVNEFLEKIRYYERTNDTISSCLFFPTSPESLKTIIDTKREELQNLIKILEDSQILTATRFITISHPLLERILPTPTPPYLQYIEPLLMRKRIWNDVTMNLNEYCEKYFVRSFITSILGVEEISGVKINPVDLRTNFGFFEISTKTFNNIKAFAFYKSSITEEGIKEVLDILNNYEGVHNLNLIFIFSSGEIDTSIIPKLERDKNGVTLLFPLSLPITKRILILYLVKVLYKKECEIEEDYYKREVKEILDDLELDRKLSVWERKLKTQGLILFPLEREYARDDEELLHGLRFYANFPETPLTPEEAFEKNAAIDEFLHFARKAGITGEIESSERLKLIVTDLRAIGFLLKKNGGYILQSTPSEERICKILKLYGGKASFENIQQYFINTKGSKAVLQTLLRALEIKGIIRPRGHEYELLDLNELIRETKEKYERLVSLLKDFETRYSFFISCKKRDYNIFSLEEFKNFINSLLQKAQTSEKMLQHLQYSLLYRLLDHFSNVWLPNLTKSYSSLKEEAEQLKEEFTELSNHIHRIKKSVEDFFGRKVVELEDEKKIHELREKLENNLNLEIDKLRDFFRREFPKVKGEIHPILYEKFSRVEDEEYYFNPKLFIVKNFRDNEWKPFEENEKMLIDDIQTTIEKLSEGMENVSRFIKTRELPPTLKIASLLLQLIKEKVILPIYKPRIEIISNLSEIRDTLDFSKRDFEERYKTIKDLQDLWEKVKDEESKFHKQISETKETYEKCEIFLKKVLKDEIAKIEREYFLLYSQIKGRLPSLDLLQMREFIEKECIISLYNYHVKLSAICERIKEKTNNVIQECIRDSKFLEKICKEMYIKVPSNIQTLLNRLQNEVNSLSKLEDNVKKHFTNFKEYKMKLSDLLFKKFTPIQRKIIEEICKDEITDLEKLSKSLNKPVNKIIEEALPLVKKGYVKIEVRFRR